MQLIVVGLSHKGAPVEVREKVAFDGTRLAPALEGLRAATGAREAVILSTCNRVELYTAQPEADDDGLPATARFLAQFHQVPEESIAPSLYRHVGVDAVRHLYRVASGLDAMVVGETQILAQVKGAYQAAKEAGHTGRVFNALFQRAFHVAKTVHSTTGLSAGSVSTASVAARLAEKVFQDLGSKRILVAGAGETAELTLTVFRDKGVAAPVVVNRTLENAERLASRFGGRAAPLDRLGPELAAADIFISCLAGQEFAVGAAAVGAAQKARRGEPMVLLDLGVPRNIHPDAHRLDNVYLFDIDDLDRIVAQNVAEREREVARALPRIEDEARQTLAELGEDEHNGIMLRLRDRFAGVGQEEISRTLDRLDLSPAQREEVEFMVRRILNKVLHEPTRALKQAARGGPAEASFLEAVARLFGIR